MTEEKRVLAIGAHPDDIEQFCGGTLHMLRKVGYELLIAPLTAGECGSRTVSSEEIKRIRASEIVAGAALLGAKGVCLNLRDGCVVYDLVTVVKLVKLIREYKPAIIFTHPTEDYMTDHTTTGQLVLWAVPEAAHPNFAAETHAPALRKYPFVYQCDPQGLTGLDGQITPVRTIVDIGEVIEQKLAAFQAHKSQMDYLEGSKTISNVEKTRRWAITRGEQVRVEYGEGFNQVLLAEYPRKNILAEILGDKVFTL